MKNHRLLQFPCQSCQNLVNFSIFDLENHSSLITCSQCDKKYAFQDETLKRQIKKFEALCRQIVESEEILSHTAVGIDVGERKVKVPYKILLTRLNSTLDLKIGNQSLTITFRVEPIKDIKS